MQVKTLNSQNISFKSPQRQRVDFEFQALKSDLLEKGYELVDIERFFLREIESREKRNALGFLDPHRGSHNDWKVLIQRFKRSFFPIIRNTPKIERRFPWENLRDPPATPEEIQEIWGEYFLSKGKVLK